MNLKKMSALKAIITFPSGFAKDTLTEIDNIFSRLWLEKKQRPIIKMEKHTICISNVHIDSLFEILMRSSVVTDVRLVIQEAQVVSKSNLKTTCNKIPWGDYLDESLPIKIKVNSIASQLFHEGAIKEVIKTSTLASFCNEDSQIETLTNSLFFEILKDKLTVSVSLAGSELYKRNYKKSLTAAAPLREDIAHFCVKKSHNFLRQFLPTSKVSTLFVPFGGSGTFIFEFLINVFNLSNNFFGKKFIFESTSIFKEKTINFLNKKCLQESEKIECELKNIIYLDNAENISKVFSDNFEFFEQKIKEKSENIFNKIHSIKLQKEYENFLKLDVKKFVEQFSDNEVVFMPLNPPYGLRQNSKADSAQFYTKIIQKINELGAALKQNKSSLCAFILCPSEETWSLAMNKMHTQNKETFHFTQGGLHIRVVNVVYSNAAIPVSS
ncbi:MAG: hypothetical protein V4591_03400 [Bdellovibrionota bacterium]